MPQFMHHEDEEILRRYFGTDECPERFKQLYFAAQKFYHGAFGGSGSLCNMLIPLVALYEGQGTVSVSASGAIDTIQWQPTTLAVALETSVVKSAPQEESEPPTGDKHSPWDDIPKNSPVRIRSDESLGEFKGKLGYFAGKWGTEQVRVRIEGDDAPYRKFASTDVEIAV